MFYPRKLSGCSIKSDRSKAGDQFGWWIGDRGIQNSFVLKCQSESCSRSSSESMKSCIDSNETDTYSSAQEPPVKLAQSFINRADEMLSLNSHMNDVDIDLDMIEKDALQSDSDNSELANKGNEVEEMERIRAHCYTPERLIRCHDYRILTPSPRFLSMSETMTTANILWSQNRRRNISRLINADAIGAVHLEALLGPSIRELQISGYFSSSKEKSSSHHNGRKCRKKVHKNKNGSKTTTSESSAVTTRIFDGEISCEEDISILNNVSSNPLKLPINNLFQLASQYDSNISSETAKTAPSLSDEFSSLSETLPFPVGIQKNGTVNGMLTLDNYQDYPDREVYILEEDRFCETNSKHNLLTRLALAIEPDGNVPQVIDDPGNVIHQLRIKVEKLQHANRDIHEEIYSLKNDFSNDTWKVKYLSEVTKKLREDIHEMRYLDDLLSLLQGKLEKISRRNWPFAERHTEYETEEMNLVV